MCVSLTELLDTVAHQLLLLLLIGDGVSLQLAGLEWRHREEIVSASCHKFILHTLDYFLSAHFITMKALLQEAC